MKHLYLFILLLFTTLINAQKLKGVLLKENDSLPADNVKIINLDNNRQTYSHKEGVFYITVSEGQKLKIESIFYEAITFTYYEKNLQQFVIYVKEKTNELNEVAIVGKKNFDQEKFNKDLNTSIQKDIEENRSMYPSNSVVGGNIGFVLTKIVEIFKRKETKKPTTILVDYEYLTALFERDSRFNQNFLEETLKIKTDQKSLFYEFCELSKYELDPNNANKEFLLTDFLIKQSEAYIKRQSER
jgi:hypothetical protein